MKKYVTPNVTFVFFECQDICTASAVNTKGNATFEDYDFASGSWI